MISFPPGGLRPGTGPDDEVIEVEPTRWRTAVRDSLDQGWTWFDSLLAVDEILRPLGDVDQLRVVLRLIRHDADTRPGGRQLHVRVPRDLTAAELDSVSDLVAGAAWYEREVHDFFGIRFRGGDDRPLLWHPQPGLPRHPLRKDEILSARVETAWPGAKEPGEDAAGQASRRRTLPPGVPDPDLLADPRATPTQIVASLAGGRVRRRP